jgi:predicted nucleotidyltransferase
MDKDTIITKSKSRLYELLDKENIRVNKLILFGSYAMDNQRSDSDIDYIVVSHDYRELSLLEAIDNTIQIDKALVSEFLIPFDILYYSDIEWEAGQSIAINEAKKYGIVLYSS